MFKFSGVKSLLVGGGDESVILSADGVVDAVFSDVDQVDGVVGESAVFDFDLYVKSLGRPIGGASEVDGDGDMLTTGPDGKDNVPVVAAAVRKRVGKKKFDVNDRQQREDKIVEMYNAGSTAGEISDFIISQKPVDGRFADIANIRSVVGKRRKRGDVALRVDSPNNVVNALKERDAGILKLYNEGKLDGPKIGALFGVGSMTVYGVVKRSRLKNPRSVARGDKLRGKSLYWSHEDAPSGVVSAPNDDEGWFAYSHPVEGSEGVLERSVKAEFFDWESAFSAEDLAFEVDGKSLKDWFTEDWVDISRPKPGGGFEPCGRSDASKGKYPKCVPASRAAKMSADEIASAVRRKRRAESVEVRKDKKPIYVSTDKKEESSFGIFEKSAIPVDAVLYARVKAEAKAKFDVYPSAYANAWLVREYKKRGGKYRTGEKGLAEDALEKGEVLRDPKGGLTAAGRRHFRETEGSNLLPGVRGRADTPKKMRRKGSFLTRFFTNPSGPMKDENGKPTRLALSAAAWGEPVPQNMEDAAELAAKGRRLLERYANPKKKSADGDNL